MQDKISIIVPIYNIENYVDKCVASMVGQTYKNLEIILVDDGSTDNSGALCDKWAKLDERIIVLHKENEGLSDARNSGLEIATGKYIGFIDGDDWLAADMYDYLHQLITKHDGDISVCEHYVEDENGRKGLIEVKGVTLEIDGMAKFPDAPTERGVKHIQELMAAAGEYNVYVIFVIQMKGISAMMPNDDTHKAFGDALRTASKAGVHVMAYDCLVTEDSLQIDKQIPVIL